MTVVIINNFQKSRNRRNLTCILLIMGQYHEMNDYVGKSKKSQCKVEGPVPKKWQHHCSQYSFTCTYTRC